MKAKPLALLLLFSASISLSGAQTTVHVQAGIGYIEHASIGIGMGWNATHVASIHYGSDFFYRPENFSTFFIKYNWISRALTFKRVMPGLGLKIGSSIYTDTYYRWKVASAVPVLTFRHYLDDRISLGAEAGVAISRIESVMRVRYGDIGKYKRYLPELNVTLHYNIFVVHRE